jgi:hypothetical protein
VSRGLRSKAEEVEGKRGAEVTSAAAAPWVDSEAARRG